MAAEVREDTAEGNAVAQLAVLPDMTIPFPDVCHPEIDRIEREAMAWVSRFAPDVAIGALMKTRAGRIVARTACADASPDLLRAYGKMLAWGFWFDDRLIDNAPADCPESMLAVASVLDILDGGRGTGAAGDPMEAAFAEVVHDLRRILPGTAFIEWQIEMRLWFTSICLQNALRISARVPDAGTYKTIRLYTVCSFPCIVLIDASHRVSVSWDDYHQPALTRLRQRAANVVAWQNDIFSFFAEREHPGQFWNLPSLYAAHGRTAEAAIEQTAQDVAAELAAFQREQSQLPPVTAGRAAHLRSLRQWMRGCRDWSLEATGRYVGWLPQNTLPQDTPRGPQLSQTAPPGLAQR